MTQIFWFSKQDRNPPMTIAFLHGPKQDCARRLAERAVRDAAKG
jgi:hypothetical protein